MTYVNYNRSEEVYRITDYFPVSYIFVIGTVGSAALLSGTQLRAPIFGKFSVTKMGQDSK